MAPLIHSVDENSVHERHKFSEIHPRVAIFVHALDHAPTLVHGNFSPTKCHQHTLELGRADEAVLGWLMNSYWLMKPSPLASMSLTKLLISASLTGCPSDRRTS